MGKGWRVGHIGGVDVRVDITWVVTAVLIVSATYSQLTSPSAFPRFGAASGMALALFTAVLFFGSVLLHELAHAAVYRSFGMHVEGVTLWFMGGYTSVTEEAPNPKVQFLGAGVGPVVNLIIGGLLLALERVLAPGEVHNVVGRIGFLNIAIGLFNAIPGFPLDGGRVLQSALWKITGDLTKATVIAARVGQAFGVLLIAAMFVPRLTLGIFSPIGLGIIGFLLLAVATSTIQNVRKVKVLSSKIVREVMSPPPPSVPAGLALGEARSRYLLGHDGEAFPVMDGGHVVGLVSLRTAAGVADDHLVNEAMVTAETTIEAGPDERMDEVTRRLGERGGHAVLVVDAGHLVGVIEPQDLERFYRTEA